MRIAKRVLAILLIFMLVLPIITYIGIVITNNSIANRIEKDLTAYELPADTVLVDSVSIAGKLDGSGNGMQYRGAILVKSELGEKELTEHYGSAFDHIEVRKQTSADIYGKYSFDRFSDEDKDSYYSVICQDDKRTETFGGFISALLDFDVRGH